MYQTLVMFVCCCCPGNTYLARHPAQHSLSHLHLSPQTHLPLPLPGQPWQIHGQHFPPQSSVHLHKGPQQQSMRNKKENSE